MEKLPNNCVFFFQNYREFSELMFVTKKTHATLLTDKINEVEGFYNILPHQITITNFAYHKFIHFSNPFSYNDISVRLIYWIKIKNRLLYSIRPNKNLLCVYMKQILRQNSNLITKKKYCKWSKTKTSSWSKLTLPTSDI